MQNALMARLKKKTQTSDCFGAKETSVDKQTWQLKLKNKAVSWKQDVPGGLQF